MGPRKAGSALHNPNAVGAGALGAQPQYYVLAQELPARHMGMLSGVLSASSWVVVGYMQGEMGNYFKPTG